MFSRRRNHPAPPPIDRTTYSAASTAATSAFLQKSQSNNSLSSAAAAAALRSLTSSPEPVGNVQTKRTIRRGSVSSTGSGSVVGGNGVRPGLRRANSSGSMTERTFRSPSPSQRNGTVVQSSPNAKVSPMTAIPKRPSSSLAAPRRMMSPPPVQGKRSSSADGAALAPPGTSRQAKRLSNVAEVDELDRAHTNFARNFMRRREPDTAEQKGAETTGAAGATPAVSKNYTHGTGSWFTQSSDNSTPVARPKTSEEALSSASAPAAPVVGASSSQPVKTNNIASSPGSHLARANYGQERSYGIAPGTSYRTPPRVYDPNSRRFTFQTAGQRTASESPSGRRFDTTEKVYDPHTRTFIPGNGSGRRNSLSSLGSQPPPAFMSRRQQAPPPVNTAIEPPPKNPARYSTDTSSPTSPRAAGVLHKQPSVVREDAEGEQQAEDASGPATKPISDRQTSQASTFPPKTYTTPTNMIGRSASLDIPSDVTGRRRNASQSPSRSARFSPSPILKPEKHVPPPRDVSPAKSALKHSPSSSVRGMSPVPTFSPLALTSFAGPPSETSEAPSLASQEGIGVRKKKSVRVSFDEQPREPDDPAGPVSTGRDLSPSAGAEMDDDLVMRPRPELPSFGSVRRDRMRAEPAEKVTEMPPERHAASSDRALGGILRNSLEPLPPDVTSKEGTGYVSDESSEADVPLSAPLTTYLSYLKSEEQRSPANDDGEPRVRDFAPVTDRGEDTDVPAINLLPPTPKLDDDSKQHLSPPTDITQNRNSMDGIVVPGGWGKDIEDVDKTPANGSNPTNAQPETPSLNGSSLSEDSAAATTSTPIQLTHSPLQLSEVDEDSDDSVAFSDAYEDPSDFEGDEGGFASLDAIVESPIVERPASLDTTTRDPDSGLQDSPSKKQAGKRSKDIESGAASGPITGTPGEGWGQATAYWARLSREKRAQIERQHMSSDDEAQPSVVAAKKPKATKARAADQGGMKSSFGQKSQAAPPTLRSSMRAQSGPTAAPQSADGVRTRQSMRSQPGQTAASQSADGVHLRSSMRSGGSMTTSLRDRPAARRQEAASVEPRGALQKKSLRPTTPTAPAALSAGAATTAARPQSPAERRSQDAPYPQVPTKKTTLHQRTAAPQVSPRLQKELASANDSDSESSFKKRRRGSSVGDSQGRYTMRASMRTRSLDQSSAPPPGDLRPSSPTSSGGGKSLFRPSSPRFSRNKGDAVKDRPQDTGMRTSLRGPAGSRIPPTAARATSAPRSGFRSRFVDSDDEDEDAPRPSHYRSRFADSDDEDEPSSPRVAPANLAPVRGIPRRQGQEDGDSTDLEDENDNLAARKGGQKPAKKPPVPASTEVDKAMAAARRNLGMTETSSQGLKEGDALQKGSLRLNTTAEPPKATPKVEDINFSPPDKKRRGFMGGILRRNRNSTASIQQITPGSPTQAPTSPIATAQSPQAARGERPTLTTPTPSFAKLVRRRSDQPRLSRGNSEISTAAAPPAQNTTLPTIPDKELDTWERPTSPVAPRTDRPSTSDGLSSDAIKLPRTMRPDLAPRSQTGGNTSGRRVQIQAGQEGSEPGEREPKAIYSQRTGKKKKFSSLRRVFGLND